tara:strand:+ start:1158 stop:1664 length:507 start_codon:yes stop_codon:yes gene_type:complete
MKDKLLLNNKVEIRKSSIHGYGVFAKEDIFKGELIEECRYAIIEPPINGNIVSYWYPWPKFKEEVTIDVMTLKKVQPNLLYKLDNNIEFQEKVIVFGYAPMYNTSKTELTRNIDWYNDLVNDIFIFEAVMDIEKDEELCIHYPLIPVKKESHGKLGGNLEDVHMRGNE